MSIARPRIYQSVWGDRFGNTIVIGNKLLRNDENELLY